MKVIGTELAAGGRSDFDRGVLTVRRTVHSIPGKGLSIGHPKSHRSARSVALDQGTLAALAEHREEAKRAAAMLGRPFSDADFVFARVDGSPWRPDNLTAGMGASCKGVRCHGQASRPPPHHGDDHTEPWNPGAARIREAGACVAGVHA